MRHGARSAYDHLFIGAFLPPLSIEALAQSAGPDSVFDLPDDTSPGPEDHFALGEAWRAVDGFLATLPPREQMIVKRVFWDGCTQTEVAREFGVSKMAISKTVARICEKGRISLAEHEYVLFKH